MNKINPKQHHNIWFVMENIRADIESEELSGDCTLEYAVPFVGADDLKYEDHIEALDELKKLGALTYSDYDNSDDSLVVIGSHELVLKIKSARFSEVYDEYSKEFNNLSIEENKKMAKLTKAQLSDYKQFLKIVRFHLPYAKGQGACNLSLSIPFSDFKDLSRINVMDIADNISNNFLVLKRKEVEPVDKLELIIYVKKKLVEICRIIDEATSDDVNDKTLGEITSLTIIDSPLDNFYSYVVNGDYRNPLRVSRSQYGRLLTQTAQSQPIEKKSNRNYFDYINSHRKNVFYKAGYQKTRILKEVKGFIMPAIPMEFIDERKNGHA